MPETAKQVVKSRTSSHSDVADTPPARAYQSAQTERLFGEMLLQRLREAKGEVSLRNLQEEWLSGDDGLVHEISVELHAAEA